MTGFLLLVLGFSAPFWWVGAVTGGELLPGLPLAALMAACPLLAALTLCAHGTGWAGVVALLKETFRLPVRAAAWWCVVAVALPVGVGLGAYAVQRAGGALLPGVHWSLGSTLMLCLMFLLGAASEEAGWSAYALQPVQRRWGTLGAGVLLGVVWAAWHVVPLLQAGRDGHWIGWWAVGTVATRITMVSLCHAGGGAVFPVVLNHAMVNVVWQMFPEHGSHFDPGVHAAWMVAAACVATWWGMRCAPGV